MEIIKFCFLITGCVLFAWFTAPLVIAKVLNPGNVIGVLFSVFCFFYGIYADEVNNFVRFLLSFESGKVFVVIIGVFIGLFFVAIGFYSAKIITSAYRKANHKGTVVVLGCKVNPHGPSRSLSERINAAFSYLMENKDAKCVLSGGQGADEVMSEAKCMFDILKGRGIEESRLFIEDKSTSTKENLAFSHEIIKENGLCEKMIIITNGFHQYRAGKIADSLGIEHESVSAKTSLLLLPTYYVRELCCILFEKFKILKKK